MKKRTPEKLLALCCLVYFASYVTRLDYAAVLVEIALLGTLICAVCFRK